MDGRTVAGLQGAPGPVFAGVDGGEHAVVVELRRGAEVAGALAAR